MNKFNVNLGGKKIYATNLLICDCGVVVSQPVIVGQNKSLTHCKVENEYNCSNTAESIRKIGYCKLVSYI